MKRPWVGPSIAYWVINRFPFVVVNAINRAKPKTHRGGSGGLDEASTGSLKL